MEKHLYQLQIAGLRWHVSSPVELKVEDSCAPFLCGEGQPDCFIDYTLGAPEEYGSVIHERSPRAYETEGGYLVERTLSASLRPSTCVRLLDNDPKHIQGWIYPGKSYPDRLIHLLDATELEIALAAMGIISLHSSLVRWRDEGVLFTAPSGTGKSTQADLWAKYENADILNGDRSLIRWQDDRWVAYGSPFAGSSNIFRNEFVPIRAIVVLRQAPENTIDRLSAPDAFRLLYSETIQPRWNTLAHTHVISIITRICAEIPVWILRCTPDQRAVDLLKQTVWGDTP